MPNLTSSINHFASLNRAPGATWTDATKRKAPHKPLLLLAVLDLVHRGVITSPFIAVTGDLVELNELFNLLAADHPDGPEQQYRLPLLPSRPGTVLGAGAAAGHDHHPGTVLSCCIFLH